MKSLRKFSYLSARVIREEYHNKILMKIFQRELLNDVVQLPLKIFAMYQAPQQHVATFQAEFTRSCIDATNHFILFTTHYLPVGPSTKYPYGMEKIKNFVVLIPAILFIYCGGGTLYESIYDLYHQKIPEQELVSLSAIAAYLASLGIETGVIFKNIMDSTKLTNGLESESFKQKLANIFLKKDPLLMAILYENIITLTSTSVPIITCLIGIYFPSPYVPFAGSFMISLIQLYLGYFILKKNVPKLIGEGVDEEELKQIVALIKKNKYVRATRQEKAIITGTEKYRFYAEIFYDIEKLQKDIEEDYQYELDKIIHTDNRSDRKEDLDDLVQTLPRRYFQEIQYLNTVIENEIMEKFQECIQVDLEIHYENNSDEEDIRDLQNLELDGRPIIQQLNKEIEGFLNSNIIVQENDNKLNFYSSKIDEEYLQENIYLYEDIRFEQMKQFLKEKN